MTTADDLKALAARVMALDGPDREVDILVTRAMLGRAIGVARYTASLDAAMSLVPASMESLNIRQFDAGCWEVELAGDDGNMAAADRKECYCLTEAPTAALALTAAALLARAAEQ